MRIVRLGSDDTEVNVRGGRSAAREADRQEALAEELDLAAAREARRGAGRYRAAARTEARTAAVLSPLAAAGYHLLIDRRWPGGRRTNVDLVLIGPGGVFIVDTKAWRDVTICGGRIHRGDADVTEELDKLRDLCELTRADLAEVGLSPGEVRAVAVLAGRKGVRASVGEVTVVGEHDVRRFVSGYGTRLPTSLVDAVLRRATTLFRELPGVEVPSPGAPPPEMVQDALFDEREVYADLLSAAEKASIEEWMVYLHPTQAKLTRRSFSGPSRIRGAAGTGKTVVALHRAAHLARTSGGRVLFTTFVRTLPEVMSNLMTQFAPDVVDSVDFVSITRFARELLKDRGIEVALRGTAAENCFTRAWLEVGRGGALERLRPEAGYWRDEIERVIKGRGIDSFEEYQALARTGRRTQLNHAARREVWALYEAYTRRLGEAGVHDFADLITMAHRELARRPLEPGYAAVIVDEAQDLSCAMVRLLHSLVGDGPNGLTLVGDGQQTIYPGGYTLAEAGISVAGRASVLDINYRNTVEIATFASEAIAGDEFSDLEGAQSRGDKPVQVLRRGAEPLVVRVGTEAERYRELVSQLRRLQAAGVAVADIGVLCATNRAAESSADALRRAGIPVIKLEHYDGREHSGVKVGTVKRAKGLEFAHVLLPQARSSLLAGAQPPDDPADRERWDLDRRELYVAITRARNGLWLAVEPGPRSPAGA
ncbi:MAG: AAA family ATPase [Propionibacteriaceae bacterium]|nr:AAA family ATPase [Propionibacteriaceae bacterium]